jgi:hypothetical protein
MSISTVIRNRQGPSKSNILLQFIVVFSVRFSELLAVGIEDACSVHSPLLLSHCVSLLSVYIIVCSVEGGALPRVGGGARRNLTRSGGELRLSDCGAALPEGSRNSVKQIAFPHGYLPSHPYSSLSPVRSPAATATLIALTEPQSSSSHQKGNLQPRGPIPCLRGTCRTALENFQDANIL